jgi:hypothetical protein
MKLLDRQREASMRKLIVAGILAALGTTLLATSAASASFDPHFTVLAKTTRHQTGDGFRFREKFFERGNRDNRVGRDHGECKLRAHTTVRCRARIHLNGEIGGFGDIRVTGNLRPHDNRLNVVGGTHDFNGVAGKLLFSYIHQRPSRVHFDLVR